MPPARLFDETLKLFLTGHGAMSLVVLQRHGLLGRAAADRGGLPRQASRRRWWRSLVRQGLVNTDQRVAAGRAGDAHLPVRTAAVRALRRDHRKAAAGEMARHRHHCRCRGPRGARRRRGASRIPKRFSLGVREMFGCAAAAGAAARTSRASHAGATALRAGFDLLLLRAEIGLGGGETSPTGGRACRRRRRPDRDRMADALAPQPRPAGEGGGPTGTAPPSPRTGRASRGFMNAAAEELSTSLLAGCRPMWAWAATWVNRTRRCIAALDALARLPRNPAYVARVRRCIARPPFGEVVQPGHSWYAVAGLLTQLAPPRITASAAAAACWSANSAASSRRAALGVRASSISICWSSETKRAPRTSPHAAASAESAAAAIRALSLAATSPADLEVPPWAVVATLPMRCRDRGVERL